MSSVDGVEKQQAANQDTQGHPKVQVRKDSDRPGAGTIGVFRWLHTDGFVEFLRAEGIVP